MNIKEGAIVSLLLGAFSALSLPFLSSDNISGKKLEETLEIISVSQNSDNQAYIKTYNPKTQREFTFAADPEVARLFRENEIIYQATIKLDPTERKQYEAGIESSVHLTEEDVISRFPLRYKSN